MNRRELKQIVPDTLPIQRVSGDRYIYVVLTQTGTNICKAIKLFTRKPYNHASITCDTELDGMFSFCRLYFNRPLPAGFMQEKIRGGAFDMFKTTPCEVYAIKVTDEQFERYSQIIHHFKEHTDIYSYNVLGLFALAFGISVRRKHRFVCSQFVAYVLKQAGIVNFQKDIFAITPDDLRYLANAELVYRGELRDYPNAVNEQQTANV
jgi:hypothetical protein